MIDRDETRLDALLREHLTAELDPQVGRCERVFRFATSGRRTSRRWVWGVAGAALAASLAIAFLTRPWGRSTSGGGFSGSTEGAESLADAETLRCTIYSQTFDDGTVEMGDDLPYRQWRQDVVESVQWYDPQDKAVIQVNIPSREVILVGMQRY